MKFWQIFAVAGAVITVGGAVFIFSRPAAAAAAGRKAFRISQDCKTIDVISESDAKSALQAAAVGAFRSKDEPAIDFIRRAIKIATGCDPPDDMKISGIPGLPSFLSFGTLMTLVGNRTVAELMALAADGGLEMAVQPGYDGATSRDDISMIAMWLVSEDMRRALFHLAAVVPVPVAPNKYAHVHVPSGARAYEWGDGLYVVSKVQGGWRVTPYNVYYADTDLGAVVYSGKTFNVSDESSALYLSFLENDGSMGAQA